MDGETGPLFKGQMKKEHSKALPQKRRVGKIGKEERKMEGGSERGKEKCQRKRTQWEAGLSWGSQCPLSSATTKSPRVGHPESHPTPSFLC